MRLAFHRISPLTAGPYVPLLKDNIAGSKRQDTVVDTEMIKAGLPVISGRGFYASPDENAVNEIRALFGVGSGI